MLFSLLFYVIFIGNYYELVTALCLMYMCTAAYQRKKDHCSQGNIHHLLDGGKAQSLGNHKGKSSMRSTAVVLQEMSTSCGYYEL